MPTDFTRVQMERARAAHDTAAREDELATVVASAKPSAGTVMSIDRAELLIEAHEYVEGEQIGLVPVGGYSDAHQVLVHVGGQVVIEPRYDHVLKQRVGTPGSGQAWTAQSRRQVRRDEVAG
jgi:hypothetical protein